MEQQATFQDTDWNRYAVCYDALLALRPYRALCATIARVAGDINNHRVIDIGSGTGNILAALFSAGGRDLVGVEVSPSMMLRAKQKLAHTSVQMVSADANQPFPFRSDTFDVLTSVNMLYAVSDPLFTLKEMYRVLKVGGRLVLVTPKKGYDNGLVLKAHCQSLKPDTYWSDPHSCPEREGRLLREALEDEEVITQMLTVAAYNRAIITTNRFHFFTEASLVEHVKMAGFCTVMQQSTYAGQGILVTARKEEVR